MRLIDADALIEEVWHSGLGSRQDCVNLIQEMPTIERLHEKWEYLKEHITEMRDADGELNQKDTCKFILELMGVIEREGEKE